jgi:hypothetical protein
MKTKFVNWNMLQVGEGVFLGPNDGIDILEEALQDAVPAIEAKFASGSRVRVIRLTTSDTLGSILTPAYAKLMMNEGIAGLSIAMLQEPYVKLAVYLQAKGFLVLVENVGGWWLSIGMLEDQVMTYKGKPFILPDDAQSDEPMKQFVSKVNSGALGALLANPGVRYFFICLTCNPDPIALFTQLNGVGHSGFSAAAQRKDIISKDGLQSLFRKCWERVEAVVGAVPRIVFAEKAGVTGWWLVLVSTYKMPAD